jgi:hypothetical protein
MLVMFKVTRAPCGRAKRREKRLQAKASRRSIHPDASKLAPTVLLCESRVTTPLVLANIPSNLPMFPLGLHTREDP